jgi:adenylylsulfate kinase
VRRGYLCAVLDGDEVRAAIVPPHEYSPQGRDAFYETLARLAVMLSDQGLVVLVAATAHRAEYRAVARGLAHRFVEVLVDVPAEECAQRDAKGLYAAAKAGKVRGVPGVDLAYEAPDSPDVVARGGRDMHAVSRLLDVIARRTT